MLKKSQSGGDEAAFEPEHEAKIKPYLLKEHEKPKYLEYDNTGIDYVRFGKYPQGKNGEELPIIWRVIDIAVNEANEKTAFLMAERILDCVPYHDQDVIINWKNSDIRAWLNGDKIADGNDRWKTLEQYSDSDKSFYDTAFSELTEEEREKYIIPNLNYGNGVDSSRDEDGIPAFNYDNEVDSSRDEDERLERTDNETCSAAMDYVFLMNTLEFKVYSDSFGTERHDPKRRAVASDWLRELNRTENLKKIYIDGYKDGLEYNDADNDDLDGYLTIDGERRGCSWWWLRNRGRGGSRSVAYMDIVGYIHVGEYYDCVCYNNIGVRPCIYVRLT
ncbi:MAG: DUF6273 domain-containing protein [Clostridiaceae bacterium]|jgi:hypothetical protein|nr:DUF6273 domain-containing protein [Clostridiaceae bacterium]